MASGFELILSVFAVVSAVVVTVVSFVVEPVPELLHPANSKNKQNATS